jgi:tetratricopeptide (TPR) repeat protein
MLIPN